jgi:hypothetical protein
MTVVSYRSLIQPLLTLKLAEAETYPFAGFSIFVSCFAGQFDAIKVPGS